MQLLQGVPTLMERYYEANIFVDNIYSLILINLIFQSSQVCFMSSDDDIN